MAGALLLLALASGAGSLLIVDRGMVDRGDARPAALPRPDARELAQASVTARPPPLPTPRARPAAEPEALTRFLPPPAAPQVQALPQQLSVPAPPPPLQPGDRVEVTLSFYYCEYSEGTRRGDGGGFCGAMRDGSIVYPGAAACDRAYLGQRFRIDGDPTGRVYRCADTGNAVHGQHRDVWFETSYEGWRWQLATGTTATIEILP